MPSSHPSGAPPTALTREEPHLLLSPQWSPTYCSPPEEPYCSHPSGAPPTALTPEEPHLVLSPN